MRITFMLLAAGLCMAGGPAAAGRPATGTMVPSAGAHGGGWKGGGWSGGGWNGGWRGHWSDGPGWHRPDRPRPGRDHGSGDDPRHDRWRWHHRDQGPDFVYPYGPGGLDGPYGAVDPYGTGFFAGAGGEVRVEGGRPHYGYDRCYPYEWAPPGPARAVRPSDRPMQTYCAVESGVRVCRRGR